MHELPAVDTRCSDSSRPEPDTRIQAWTKPTREADSALMSYRCQGRSTWPMASPKTFPAAPVEICHPDVPASETMLPTGLARLRMDGVQ